MRGTTRGGFQRPTGLGILAESMVEVKLRGSPGPTLVQGEGLELTGPLASSAWSSGPTLCPGFSLIFLQLI